MKITVIGGGGVRSMFLAKSIAQKAEKLRIDELCFMDNNKEKLRIYGGMASHVANLLCPKMKFMLTTDSIEAVKDADYVITTIRVGEDEMRAKDERIEVIRIRLGAVIGLPLFFTLAMISGRFSIFTFSLPLKETPSLAAFI